MTEDYRAKGGEIAETLLGEQFRKTMEGYAESDEPFAASAGMALDFAFGRVWSRPGLDMKSRSLVTIGVLIGRGAYDELRNHVRAGLNNGLTPKEIEEALYQAIPYAGFPAFAQAQFAAIAGMRDAGLDAGKDSSERGLLQHGKE